MSKIKNFSAKLEMRNVKLRLSISVIFLLLIIPVFIAFILYSYQTNYSIYKKNAIDLVTRANNESIHNLIDFLDPIADAARVTAKLVNSNPELINQDKIADHIIVNLENNPNIVSYFLASREGSFRQVQKTNKSIPVGERVPPDGSRFVSWIIDRSKNQNAESTYTFFRSWGDVIEKFTSPTKYDPRTRNFYKGIVNNVAEGKVDIPFLDDPFFATSTKQAVIGTTYPILVKNELFGTVTAQVQVKTFADFLEKNKISKNSQTIIFNASGDIVVHPDVNSGFIKKKDTLVPRKILELDNSAAALAMEMHDASKLKQIELFFGDKKEPYLAIFSSFPADYIKPWSVMTIVPISDFMGELNRINQNLILFGVLAFMGIVFLTFYLSKLISRPLESLTTEIQNILAFKSENTALVKSSIYEISTLSKAIRRLKSTIAAFTSYVPRDLVNDLLNSGKDIELGGESRYLTILFSDLKDFSSLSEITPSRELLLRVSSYLELMTYAIKEEGGTADKKPPLTARIGIHSDAVLVGNIGSSERLSYTVMGDGVNIASRLEGMNKEFGTSVCVSHSLFKEAGERLWVRPIDQILVKGRKSELLIYELVGIRDGDAETIATQAEQDLCELTEDAFEHYVKADYQKAKSLYQAIVEKYDDQLSRVMIEKCQSKL